MIVVPQFSIVQLHDLIEEIGEKSTSEILADFSCPLDSDVESFLKTKSIPHEKTDLSRTYLIMDFNDGKKELIAYFTLASKPMKLENDLSKGAKRKILGTGYNPNVRFNAILIGQLAKNYKREHDLEITGTNILHIALLKVLEIKKLIGGRVTYLECKDDPKLRKFYEYNGFMLYTNDNGIPIRSEQGLLIYIRPTNSIKIIE